MKLQLPKFPTITTRWLQNFLILSAMGGILAYGLGFVWHWVIDDSGISFAYARHLSQGDGLVAVVGGYNVEGYSNFLWVLLLAVVDFVGMWLPTAAKPIGALLGIVTIGLSVRVVQRLSGREWYELRWEDVTPALLLGWSSSYVVWMPAGLENTLYTALLMGTILLDLREREAPTDIPLSSLTALGAALTRPEGIVFAAIFGGLKLIDALGDRRYLRQMLQYALITLGGFLTYHAWHYWQFSDIFPNTYYAKKPGMTADKFESGWAYLKKSLVGHGYVYLLPIAVLGTFHRWRRIAGVLGVIGGGCFFVLYSGGDWMPHARFLSFFLPALAVLIHLGIGRLADGLRAEPSRRHHRRAAVALMVALGIYWGQHNLPMLEKIEKGGWCHFCNRLDDARSLKDLSSQLDLSTSSVLTHDFGGFAWESSPTFMPFDYLGLCDPTLARIETLKKTEKYLPQRHRLQYVFHELEAPPTFLYFPSGWWKRHAESTEVRRGYYHLSKKHLGENRRGDARFALFRGAYIDYFAPLDQFVFEPLTKHLIVAGHALDVAESNDQIRVRASLLTTQKLSMPPRWHVRLERDGVQIDSAPNEFFGGMASLVRQWEPGEPYLLDGQFSAPEGSGPIRVSIGVREAGEVKWYDLGTVDPDSAARDQPLRPPAFPTNLPAPRSAELAELRRQVWQLNARRQRLEDLTIQDPQLSDRLQEMAETLEANHPAQAYLAYVLALQADRSESDQLFDPIWELRPLATNHHYAMQLELLRRFFETRSSTWGLRAAEYLTEAGDLDLARQLAERLVVSHPDDERRLERLRDTLQGASWDKPVDLARSFEPLDVPHPSFEAKAFSEWKLDADAPGGDAFKSGPWRLQPDASWVSGLHGERAANSFANGGDRNLGTLRSPSFTIDGSILSFMAGGGGSDRDVGVKLHVEGKSVATHTAHGEDSEHLRPIFWDVSNVTGKEAYLTIYDSAKGRWGHVIADDFRWGD